MNLLQFEKNLQNAKNFEELNSVLTAYLKEHSITMFSFTYYSKQPNLNNELKYDFASKEFEMWHKHYLAEGYAQVDSCMDTMNKNILPHSFDIREQLKAAKTGKERKMRLDSLQYGAEKGMTIPLYGPQNDFAILLVDQKKGQRCLDNFPALKYELFTAGYYYFHFVRKFWLKTAQIKTGVPLSKRELQVLILIEQGHSVAQIAKKLFITIRTVNFHIQRVNKRLGVKNKYQSVARALAEGWLPR